MDATTQASKSGLWAASHSAQAAESVAYNAPTAAAELARIWIMLLCKLSLTMFDETGLIFGVAIWLNKV